MPTPSDRVELTTPLGDELLFHGMHAQEELSRPGEYQLDLISKNKDVDRDKILGAKVTVKVLLQNDGVRYFNGYVTRFSAGESLGRYSRYHAVVRPWLWLLTRTADCRIFQEQTVRQIVEEVFADHPGVADFVFDLTEDYRTWNYCVQYRETDFNFVSRLLEHEGIYYYYRHTEGHDTLVLTDSTDKHEAFPGYETLQFIPPQIMVKPGIEHVSTWGISRKVQPGVYVHDDYDFERPSVDLTTTRTLPRNYTHSEHEVYDYPGVYVQKPHGERYAHVRIDEYGAQFETAQAATNYRGVSVGSRFTLEGHSDKVNGEYLVIGATQSLETSQYESGDTGGAEFRCSFTALSCSQQFRPRRMTPKPSVQGPQTAVVVGPAGDEIYTDKFGRVKVQFHWDRRGKKDENSSCWVRVSHPWAGKGWGSVATPRIGQEVIVDFLEGDPDQPIIVGRVYNEELQPPFGFPAGAVLSGIKSQTHKGAGYNELSMDDTAGKEKITIHGQYDMNTTVEHDQTTTVHNNRTDAIDVDDSETVGANQTIDVGANQSITVGANQTVSVTANRSLDVGANESISVGANRTAKVNVNDSVEAGVNINAKAGVNIMLEAGVQLGAKAGAMAMVEAPTIMITGSIVQIGDGVIAIQGSAITLSAGGSSIAITGGGIVITAPTITSAAGAMNKVMGGVVMIN